MNILPERESTKEDISDQNESFENRTSC
jgi:hypothetical protein